MHQYQEKTKNCVWRDPTIHFILIGSVIFFLQGLLSFSENERETILITQRIKDEINQSYRNQYNKAPSEGEIDRMLAVWIEDELIYRRGLSLELDKNDSIIRQRIIQKTKYLFRNLAIINEPSEQELRKWYSRRVDTYRKPPRYSFDQILVRDTSKQGRERALSILLQINNGKPAHNFTGLYHAFRARGRIGLEVSFGKEFVGQLDLLRQDEWQLLQSKKGWHLVCMQKITYAPKPKFEELQPLLISEWKKQQQRVEEKKLVDELREQYEIREHSSS
jgi:hypothetical protein